MATVLVSGRMDQCAAMAEAMARAGTQGRDPWLTDVSTVRPLRATPALDAICDRWTAARSFLDLLTQPAGYRPTIRLDLMGRDGVLLARTYNRVQRAWGDPGRAYVTGAGQLIGRAWPRTVGQTRRRPSTRPAPSAPWKAWPDSTGQEVSGPRSGGGTSTSRPVPPLMPASPS